MDKLETKNQDNFLIWISWVFSGCQKNVAVFKRFSTTTYAAIPSSGI
jgi:hypothetical protein